MSAPYSITKASRRKKTIAGESLTAGTPARRDDLSNIDGIDPVMEMALNSIGVRQFADLRQHTPESLALVLRERTGTPVEADTIAQQDWIGWADLLAGEAEKTRLATNPALPEEKSGDGSSKEASRLDLKLTATTEIKNPAPEERRMEKPESENPGAASNEAILSIQQARFKQVEMPDSTTNAAIKMLRSEIDCRVVGAKTLGPADRVALCAQILAVDTATGEYRMLASQLERFYPDRSDYRLYIDFSLPQVGRYQLKVVTFLLEVNSKIAFHQGPMLRVVP